MPYSGPEDSALPDYVQELPKDDRAQWVAIFNSVYEDCTSSDGEDCEGKAFRQANGVVMGDEQQENQLPGGPDQCVCPECGHVVEKVRGEPCRSMECPECGATMVAKVDEDETQENMQANVVDKTYKTKWDGRDWLVVPTVMIKEGVLNGELVLADELSKFPDAWNGRPFVIEHPKQADAPVSANDPKMMDQHQVGQLFGTEFKDGALLSEIWLDVRKAEKVKGGADLIQRILKGEPVEVSTGYFRDKESRSGDWHGQAYDGVARNLRPDHLAALLDSVGACSWEDGCGCPRVNEEGPDGILWTRPAELIYNAGRYDGIDFTPPKGAQAAYRNGLERHEKGETGDGLEQATVRQARRFADGQACSPEWARKGNRWWGRNERFADEEPGTPAYAAAQLWGGRNWFARIVEQMDAADASDNEVEANVRSAARTPTYSGTSDGQWNAPTLDDYANAYDGDAGKGGVADRPAAFKNWVAGHTLLGDGGADNLRDLTFFPVVGTDGKLYASALRAVLGGRGSQAQVPAGAKASAQAKARSLLEKEFDVATDEQTNERWTVARAFNTLASALGIHLDSTESQEELEDMAKSKTDMVKDLCTRLELNADDVGEELNALSATTMRAILNAMQPVKEPDEEEPEEEKPMPQEEHVEPESEPETQADEEPQANEQPCAEANEQLQEKIAAQEQRIADLEKRLEAAKPVVQQYQEAQASEKARLVKELVGNEQCAFSEDELNEFDVPKLQKLARSLMPRNYAGQEGGQTAVNKKQRRLVPYKTIKAEEK